MSDSQIRSPIHTIVNNEATGGSHAAKDNTPVDTAAMSTISLVSSTMIKSFYVSSARVSMKYAFEGADPSFILPAAALETTLIGVSNHASGKA